MFTISAIFCFLRRRKQVRKIADVEGKPNPNSVSLEVTKVQFTHSEIKAITINFERVIGSGAFGSVYLGHFDQDSRLVAVKMISASFVQDSQQFQTEAEQLMGVHHRNLNSLVGYCCEAPNFGLLYEHASNGNLKDHLSDGNTKAFSWEKRLQVALDIAQGLEYLHNRCNPPIIHGNLKPTNILLDEEFNAKLTEFGLSIVYPIESGSHQSTRAMVATCYHDPMYYISLTQPDERSDAFSFGVVLLELITGQTAIGNDRMKKHIISRVVPRVKKGEIESIVTPSFGGEFDINSVSKAAALAMACVSYNMNERPTIENVMTVLNECLELETLRTRKRYENVRIDQGEVVTSKLNFAANELPHVS